MPSISGIPQILVKYILIFFHVWYYLCRAVGTFARALDCSSSIRQPSLHMSAAAASRDITLVRGHVQLYHNLKCTSVSLDT